MSTHFEDAEKTVALACENRGQGNPCLMFVPGWCESRGVFAPVMDRLQSVFTQGVESLPIAILAFPELFNTLVC